MTKTIIAIGGTGAQGGVVVRYLAKSGDYAVKVLTRDTKSKNAQELAALPNVTLIEGSSYKEQTLLEAFKGAHGVFVNTNGFALGMQAETYWGIRMYELASLVGVKHFVYSGLDYVGRLTGFNPKYLIGHYEGKGRVGEFLRSQPKEPMAWTYFTSGPYMEMLNQSFAPMQQSDGTYVFNAPLQDGAVPLISLDDLAGYVLWIFNTPEKSNGLYFGIATEHVKWADLAKTFTKVTGKPAVYNDVPLDVAVELGSKTLTGHPDKKLGTRHAGEDEETLLTYRQNFSAWWNMYRDGIIKRDYAFLDDILPTRFKSVEEWMTKTGYTGERKTLLKDVEDLQAM